MPSITSVHVDVPAGTRHLALPSDLFALTVYCDDGLHCAGEDEDFVPEVAVTTLRTRPGRFVSGGRGELTLVLLAPAAFVSILRAPLEGMRDRRLPLAQLCGTLEQRRLRDSLRLADSPADRVACLARWLEGRLGARSAVSDAQRRVAQATQLITHAPDAPDLDTLATTIGVGRRQLERDFDHWLGVSPSHFVRLVRFQRAGRALASGLALADVAYDAGYADQPHLSRSVRTLSGMTPRELQVATRAQGRDAVRATLADRLLIGAASDVTLDAPSSSAREHARLHARTAPH